MPSEPAQLSLLNCPLLGCRQEGRSSFLRARPDATSPKHNLLSPKKLRGSNFDTSWRHLLEGNLPLSLTEGGISTKAPALRSPSLR